MRGGLEKLAASLVVGCGGWAVLVLELEAGGDGAGGWHTGTRALEGPGLLGMELGQVCWSTSPEVKNFKFLGVSCHDKRGDLKYSI